MAFAIYVPGHPGAVGARAPHIDREGRGEPVREKVSDSVCVSRVLYICSICTFSTCFTQFGSFVPF